MWIQDIQLDICLDAYREYSLTLKYKYININTSQTLSFKPQI